MTVLDAISFSIVYIDRVSIRRLVEMFRTRLLARVNEIACWCEREADREGERKEKRETESNTEKV